MTLRSISPLFLLGLLAGCSVGPGYAGPPATISSGVPPQFAHANQVSVSAPAADRWWAGFDDPVLDELQVRAIAGSPDIAIADARLRGARAALRLERANGSPRSGTRLSTIQAHLPGVNISQGAGAAGDDDFDFYNAGFDASWEIDFFGGQRRKMEAARASLAASEADTADTRLRLTAEVAMAYASLRDHQQRVALTRRASDIWHRSLGIAEQRAARGTAAQIDVERMRAVVATGDAELAPLIAETETRMNALAILTGVAPGALDALLASVTPVPLPPAEVAIGDPAALLQRRPDIRAAERRLAADTARIGVARAGRFPRVQLFGLVGFGGSSPSDILDIDKVSALAAPTLQWDLLDFGRNAARVGQAEARRDEAEAFYRKTVLSALSDAQNALSRFGQRRIAVAALIRARTAADRTATMARQRFEAGTVTMLDMHEADRDLIAAEMRLATAKAALAMDFIALQKALGLGWAPAASDRAL